jgi:hypothetical protein
VGSLAVGLFIGYQPCMSMVRPPLLRAAQDFDAMPNRLRSEKILGAKIETTCPTLDRPGLSECG